MGIKKRSESFVGVLVGTGPGRPVEEFLQVVPFLSLLLFLLALFLFSFFLLKRTILKKLIHLITKC